MSAGRKAPHYLLDTNTVSYILKGRSSAARARLATLPDHEPAGISAITEAELRYGITKAGASPKQLAALEGFLTMVHPVPWDSTAAQAYCELRPQQERRGKSSGQLGPPDRPPCYRVRVNPGHARPSSPAHPESPRHSRLGHRSLKTADHHQP